MRFERLPGSGDEVGGGGLRADHYVELLGVLDAALAAHRGLAGGGSLSYSLPAWGLTLTAAGQGLLAHEQAGFREWGVAGTVLFDPGAPGRGIALRLWTLADASAAA